MNKLLMAICIALALCGTCMAQGQVQMRHGVVFYCPENIDEGIRQLQLIKNDGFKLIEFSSWIWTIPTEGSDLEKRVNAVLNWCDANDMSFFLIHNVQFLDEGGGLNEGVIHPDQSIKYITDWARVLKGHKCVLGVILGNEVIPSLGTPKEAPILWSNFGQWLKDKHGSIASLNSAWKTKYKSFDEVNVPAKGSPGELDVQRYARLRFAHYYGVLFNNGLRPVLGEKLYGQKTWLDPFLHRDCKSCTMACWDDLVAQYPIWQIKCCADTTDKPIFNSELHLYHDDYAYYPSVARSKYRYFTSALLGEYLTASFAWGQWKKPNIAQFHAATPGVLANLSRVEKPCRALAGVYQHSDLAVLVTERNFYQEITNVDKIKTNPLSILYAQMGTLGRPWRYLLETDLRTFKKGTLVVWSAGVSPDTAKGLIALPKTVEIIAVNSVPVRDEYNRDLQKQMVNLLRKRINTVPLAKLATTIGHKPGLPASFRQTCYASYMWWGPDRGEFSYAVPYCAVEYRSAPWEGGLLVALINNTEEPQVVTAPWKAGSKVTDLTSNKAVKPQKDGKLHLKPLETDVLLVKQPIEAACYN